MNKAAIKKDLRRSACADECSAGDINLQTWEYLIDQGFRARYVDYRTDWRIFFLLVAEAL